MQEILSVLRFHLVTYAAKDRLCQVHPEEFEKIRRELQELFHRKPAFLLAAENEARRRGGDTTAQKVLDEDVANLHALQE